MLSMNISIIRKRFNDNRLPMSEQDVKLVGQSPPGIRDWNVTVNITVKTVMINEGELFLHIKRQRPSNVSHVSTELISSEMSYPGTVGNSQQPLSNSNPPSDEYLEGFQR